MSISKFDALLLLSAFIDFMFSHLSGYGGATFSSMNRSICSRRVVLSSSLVSRVGDRFSSTWFTGSLSLTTGVYS